MAKRFWNAFFLDEKTLDRLPDWIRSWTTIGVGIYLFALAVCLIVTAILLIRLGLDALLAPESELQQTIRNFLLAFASAFGAPFLVWRAIVAHRQATAASEQARIALESYATGIFSKSVELMGSMRQIELPQNDGTFSTRSVPNIEARLGSIYSLERLLHSSEKDRRAILETLCAYVRENTPLEIPQTEPEVSAFLRGESPPKPTLRKDVQAAITVIGRRPPPFDEGLDFKRTNLIAYDFSKLNFQNSDFTGTFLDGAKMDGAFFTNSVIRHAFLRHATMHNANFDLSSFDDCRFDRAQIDRTSFKSTVMVDADLRRATVSSIHLEGADLKDAFGYGLQFAVENVKDLSTSYVNGQELLGVFQLFQKATTDEKTIISQHARDAIDMMTAISKAS